MDMTTFFAYARRAPFGGRLSQSQIDGMNTIYAVWRSYKLSDPRWLANILAQIFHETGGRMQPVRETFASSDKQAIDRLNAAWKKGQLKWVKTPYWRDGWFGRGGIQITHEDNYAKLGKRLNVDLVGKPSLALDPKISAQIAIVGMTEGLFTGKRLSDFFNATRDDASGARGIVNGSDKAQLIAGYHRNFLDAITAANVANRQTEPLPDVKAEDAKPDDVPAGKSGSVLTMASGLAGTAGVSLITGISNPWAFAGLALVVVVGGVFGWLVWSGRLTINRGKAV